MVISRIGSIVVERLLKLLQVKNKATKEKEPYLKFTPYKDYIEAEQNDSLVKILNETNNTYRTIIAVFIVAVCVKIYDWLLFDFVESFIDITKQMEMVLYRADDDDITVNALVKDETIWLTQKAMAELFRIDKSGISRHLAKIFETGELDESLVVAKIATTNPHGKTTDNMQYSPTNYYNLDAIISVGYRVNSIQATKFRIWATGILKEYMIKGFAMDDERLKQGKKSFKLYCSFKILIEKTAFVSYNGIKKGG